MANSFRRTVEGWMSDHLYEKLGEEPNVEVTWKFLRNLVGHQLFGAEFVTVPYIESANYYNQMFVFTKQCSILSTLKMKEPTYKVVGNLDYLVNRDASNWSPQFDLSPWDIADSSSMYREYILRISSNQTGVEKTISLKVLESHARSAQQPVLGSAQIHRNLVQELESENTLYVITDVVLASYVELMIRIGDRQIVFVCDRDMPIGFKYHKYRLTRSGTFIYELNTSLKVLDKEAIWLHPAPQPIPAHPQWTITRRRYPNVARRRTKNNLTIPSPMEVPGMNRVIRPLEVGILRNHHLPPIPEQDMEFADQQVNEEEINRWPDRLLQRFAFRPRNRRPHRTVSMVTMPGND